MTKAVLFPIPFILLLATAVAPAQTSPTYQNNAVNEAVMRQADKIVLQQKLEAANAAVEQKDYVAAAQLYEDAYNLVEDIGGKIPIPQETEQTISGLVSVRMELAREAQRRGDLHEADQQVLRVLKVAPNDPDAIAFKRHNDELIAQMRGVRPDLATQQELPGIENQKLDSATLARDGQMLYEAGKLEEAQTKLQQAMQLDPDNRGAFYYLSLVKQARYAREDHHQTLDNDERIVQVERAWELPVNSVTNLSNPYFMTNLVYTGQGREAIYSKLNRIQLDNVQFQSLPLSEVIRYLREQAQLRDPDKQGINFLFNPNVEAIPATAVTGPGGPGGGGPPAAINPANGLPEEPAAATAQQADATQINVNNLQLNNVSLAQLLDSICMVADHPVKYSVEDYGVIFSEKGPDSPQYEMRTFKVDPNTFYAGLQNVSSFLFGSVNITTGQGGGSGSGDSGGGGGGGFIPPVYDYGSSLWVAALGITNNALSLLATNTQADILYEIQETTNILSSWTSYGFIYGSELTNWTLAGAPVGNDGSTFYRIRSWQSIGGVPIWWWLTYFGQDTNVDGEAFSPSGDGWTLLQCYQNGFNPTNWVTPPAPQGLTITSYNTNGTASLNWMLSAGPVTGYIVQTPSGTNIVGSSVDSFTDSSSSDSATYSIQAIYAGGLSAWSPSVSVQDFENEITSPVSANNILSASIIGGPVGSAYLAVSAIPADTYELQVTRVDIVATYYHADASYNATFNIPISNPTNGFYLLTNSYMPPDAYVGEYPTYIEWYAQAIETNGTSSSFVPVGSSYTSTEDSNQASWTVPPFFDGRIQMKQDLIFLLRDPNEPAPFSYDTINGDSEIGFTLEPTNYAYAGIYNSGTVWNGYEMTPTDHSLDVYRPFEENYIYANFVFNSENVDSNGDMTTGASAIGNGENNLGPPFEEYDTLTLQVPATNQFQAPTTEGATIPSLLAASSTSWLFTYYGGEWGNYGNLNFGDLGVYTYFDGTSPFFMP